MRNIITKILFISFIFLGNFSLLHAANSTDSTNINLNINYCNLNSVCDSPLEDYLTCPLDCPAICNNNNICEVGIGEDTISCPLDCVVIPPTPSPHAGGSSGSFISSNYFENIKVEVGYNNAFITWKSPVSTMSILKWGTTADCKDGIIKNVNFLLDHKIEITDLKDGTFYYFKIESDNLLSVRSITQVQVFKTLSRPDIVPPGNPSNVKAESNDSGITIFWKNPLDLDFDYIRVMKNTDRYYASPFTGTIVYEGRGSYFTDSKVKENTKYFYSLFSRDNSGNYSSGSLIGLIHKPTKIDNEKPKDVIEVEEIEVPKNITEIFKVVQDSVSQDFNLGSILNLDGDVPFSIKTNYSSKEKNDDIWVEIRNAEREIVNQYFFKKEKDNDGFVSVNIPIFDKDGYYSVAIYGYNGDTLKILNQGAFQISKAPVDNMTESSSNLFGFIVFGFIILIPLFWILYLIIRKLTQSSQ